MITIEKLDEFADIVGQCYAKLEDPISAPAPYPITKYQNMISEFYDFICSHWKRAASAYEHKPDGIKRLLFAIKKYSWQDGIGPADILMEYRGMLISVTSNFTGPNVVKDLTDSYFAVIALDELIEDMEEFCADEVDSLRHIKSTCGGSAAADTVMAAARETSRGTAESTDDAIRRISRMLQNDNLITTSNLITARNLTGVINNYSGITTSTVQTPIYTINWDTRDMPMTTTAHTYDHIPTHAESH